ncbi:MAG TPA: hypothetical protein VHT50_08545 [Mycobacterium sp.]|nr:hypothetical protein [Mycobacterium sp.]
MTDEIGDRVTPLMDNAVAIHGYGGVMVIASHLGSVHTLITIRGGGQFTQAASRSPERSRTAGLACTR